MKRYLVFLCAIFLIFGLAQTAGAAPYTWTDNLDFNPDISITWWGSHPYTHNITDNSPIPFVVGEDVVYGYSLSIGLYDDNKGLDELLGCEIAYINQPGLLKDGFYDFNYTSNTYGWSLAGRSNLNNLGELEVTITSLWGDFSLASSTLTACGENNAPVPEPVTMLLLGSGLVGLAGFRRKFKK
ncbi:MAG: PEP-CTERM sorting domain-containing protein [Deltaproteobacteria bacterium]|nr:PEP-CTERM sorting domain-containing protein [Deltaproteobacteria bacterium]